MVPPLTATHASHITSHNGEPSGLIFGASISQFSDSPQSPSFRNCSLEIRWRIKVFHGSRPGTNALGIIFASEAFDCDTGSKTLRPPLIVGMMAFAHFTRALTFLSGRPPHMKFRTNALTLSKILSEIFEHNARYVPNVRKYDLIGNQDPCR